MRITLKRSGGFMGRSLYTQLDTASLPADEADVIEKLLTDLDLQALPSSPHPTMGADRFTYELTVVEDDETRTCYFSDEDTSQEMALLLRHLTRIARHEEHDQPSDDAPPDKSL
jgi:hypothetical protein